MAINLSEGAIAELTETDGQAKINPILQVVDLRLVVTQNQKVERYRVLLSDGVHFQQGMLGTQNNALVQSKSLRKGSIVQLGGCMCNTVQNRKIIIIIDLKVLLEECDVIGQPQQYGSGSAPAATPSAQVQPTVYQPTAPSSYAPPHAGNNVAKPNVPVGITPNQVKIDRSTGSQSHGGYVANNANSGRFGATDSHAMPSKTEMGGGNASISSYGRPSPAPHQQQPPPMYMNRAPVSRSEAPPRIIPIAVLTPYQQGWTIKARVTAKGGLRKYTNARGSGQVFSFDLLDSDGGEIRVTCFNAVVDQYYDIIEVGRVYLISKGSLKPTQRSFNHLNHKFEITLDNSSTVELCHEDDNSIPKQQFNFQQISQIERMDPGTIVDLIGVVFSVSPSTSIMRKDGVETQKRALQLRDMSGKSVELTLWGNFCNEEGLQIQQLCDSGDCPVVAVKAGRVTEFNGKSVGTLSSSQLLIDPDIPEARHLKVWFENEGRTTQYSSISRETSSLGQTDVRKTISQIKDENLGCSEKTDWITVSAYISFIKQDNFCYPACPLQNGDRPCNKKVTDNGDGSWSCARCEKTFQKCEYRYILQLQIQDHTGVTWVTAFQEVGSEIMGMSADDLYAIKFEQEDEPKFAEVVRKVQFTRHIFKLKVKEETYIDEKRVKSTVVKAEKLSYVSEPRFLLQSMGIAVSSSGNALVNTPSGAIGGRQPTTPPVRNYGGVSSNPVGGVRQPASQVGQNANQYSGSRYTASGTTGSLVRCGSCNGTGHDASSCPSYTNGQGQGQQSYGGGYPNRASSGGGGDTCFKCNQSGHWASNCPNASSVPQAYGRGNVTTGSYGGGGGGGGGGASGECFKCKQSGHWARDCPNVSNVPPAYGSGAGRSGGYSNQRVGRT